MPSWPSPSGSAHGLKVWDHRGLIGHSGNDTPLFPYKCNKTKVSHLLVMSIQSIHDWSSIKHTDYSSPVLRECHQQANMAARWAVPIQRNTWRNLGGTLRLCFDKSRQTLNICNQTQIFWLVIKPSKISDICYITLNSVFSLMWIDLVCRDGTPDGTPSLFIHIALTNPPIH